MERGLAESEKNRIVGEQLKRFGLIGMEKRFPAQLSGGQQQRVALARMLAARPGILMLDEPFSALDAHLKSSLEQNLIGLFEEYRGTILYVSHDIDEAYRFCDRIAVVDNGRICEIGHEASRGAPSREPCRGETVGVQEYDACALRGRPYALSCPIGASGL